MKEDVFPYIKHLFPTRFSKGATMGPRILTEHGKNTRTVLEICHWSFGLVYAFLLSSKVSKTVDYNSIDD